MMYKLTIEQKRTVKRKAFTDSNLFNPVQDINGDWFISQQEVDQCDNELFSWVKDLPKSEFIPKPLPELFG
jgi:hypothetical protein